VSRWALAALALFAAVACATTGAVTPTSRHLILISLDALRPAFYLDPAFDAPTLQALAAEGSHARAAESVFPTLTYPAHASIATGVRPARHGIFFNIVFRPDGGRSRWYEEAADLRAPPLWAWARAAGLTTAAVSWPATLGASIDWLLAERDYYARPDPARDLVAASTPGLFGRIGVAPLDGAGFKAPARWDAFLTAVATAIIREARPHLLMLHLIEADAVQHAGGPDGDGVKAAVARLDAHVRAMREAIVAAGIADRTSIIVTGDHGFQDVREYVYPNHVLAGAGLRGCPRPERWRATTHAASGGGAIFVHPPGDAEATALAEAALRREAGGRYTVLTRAELDAMGAMTGAALGLEAAPGWAIGTSCDRGLTEPPRGRFGGTHGFLPTRPSMATGFIAAGAGVRAGVALERVRLVDVAPTAAKLLGVPAPPVEGRVLEEIVR
jgi:predicted AlkP superfamily pyrophosphatase or phosphodiesterase